MRAGNCRPQGRARSQAAKARRLEKDGRNGMDATCWPWTGIAAMWISGQDGMEWKDRDPANGGRVRTAVTLTGRGLDSGLANITIKWTMEGGPGIAERRRWLQAALHPPQ